uniref:Uncharacterized protein n=1 Tax=Timema shepardi TaxID=629360 RepID=A0A7R9B2A0_TIMSH|nr:unnamed protein product [Timema shepardi]
MTRLFGSVDTEEVRELKVNLIDQRIKEGHSSIKNAKEELIEFSTLALADIDRFQQQKVVDIRETLAGYVLLQIKMCRKEIGEDSPRRHSCENHAQYSMATGSLERGSFFNDVM